MLCLLAVGLVTELRFPDLGRRIVVWTIGAGSQKAEVRRREPKDKTQDVVEFARSRLGFFPDPQQEELLRVMAALDEDEPLHFGHR